MKAAPLSLRATRAPPPMMQDKSERQTAKPCPLARFRGTRTVLHTVRAE